jgi:hypothetical protein
MPQRSLEFGLGEGVTYLEKASQSILDLSNLIDITFPTLAKDERVAIKFKVMASLLNLKADQIIKSEAKKALNGHANNQFKASLDTAA